MITAVPTLPRRRRVETGNRGGSPPIDVLVCGSSDRADDGAPILAAERTRANLPEGTRLRIVGQLDIDHLLSVPPGGGVVIVDAAIGIKPGAVVELPLTALSDPDHAIRPRSSHALEIPEVVGLAEMIRGRPLPGRIVAVGARSFGVGKALSPSVVKALQGLADAILVAVEHVREAALPARAS